MKIALISSALIPTHPPHYGGMEQVCFDLACGLTEMGHKVVVFATRKSEVPPKGFLCETIEPAMKVEVNWLEKEMEMYRFYNDKLGDFDCINGHDWFGCEYLYKSEHPEAHVLHTHHGGLLWRSKPPNVEKVNLIAISEWMKRVYESQRWTAKFVHNGINLDNYKFKKDGGDHLLFIGRISKLKCPDVAIEVAKRAGMKLDVLGGTFVPDQGYVQRIRHLCEANGFGFYPDAPHKKKIELMQNANCLLFPSNMGEPFGLCPAEAGACGCAVVAWDDGAVKEVVENGVTGFVVPKTVEAMAEALKKIDEIKPEACRDRVERLFSRQAMARNYVEKAYKPVLRGEEW